MSEAAPANATVSDHGVSDLDPRSYIASRLEHASPEHLHLTSRRFFIGPIPEGWLNSNRKSWYRRRLELSNYSRRQATFVAAQDGGAHHRTASGLQQPSLAARMQFSFPQPEDVFDETNASGNRIEEDEDTEEDTDAEVETTAVAPVSTVDASQALGISDPSNPDKPKRIPTPRNKGLSNVEDGDPGQSIYSKGRAESWQTAKEDQNSEQRITLSNQGEPSDFPEDSVNRTSTSTRGANSSFFRSSGLETAADNIDSSSRTALLPTDSPEIANNDNQPADKSMVQHLPAPVESSGVSGKQIQNPRGVRFKVTEGVTNRQHRISKRVDTTRGRVANKVSRRDTLKEGTIIKMERMLVRMDVTLQQISEGFDENESIKTETQQIEKWREFMVVARRSSKEDEDDFRLQFYKTRVIPEIENKSTKKKPAREIKLLHKSTHVNMFASLDKTVVIWHPYRKGTRIVILRPGSAAHSVEWYTFLRHALGWQRPNTLQVNVPDLDVTLHLEKPFRELAVAGLEAENEEAAIARTAEAEKAVASKIVSQSMELLRKDPEWTEVLKQWTEAAKMGLAWKRYDRLEWIYGINEQKMFGSIAMQHSYDLELRPKHHYPTSTSGKKNKVLDEPPPIEGFLVRLTSQKGINRRFGKAFFKRLYYSTHDQYLVFNRPAKAMPPHPSRLATVSGSNIPSSKDIIEKTPLMYEIEPFKTEDGKIKWLKPGQHESVHQHDTEASEEARRTVANLKASDGFINMCYIMKARKLHWGADEADEALDSGSDVDFHADVTDTRREDGTTKEIDDDRVFELLLDNGLIVRLQAYNQKTRDEWIKRLNKLSQYWRLRSAADVLNFKAVRQSNLKHLNIDEEQEARLGQFAHKWEVSRSDASPELYNMCRLTPCRNVTYSGPLFRKSRRHSTFKRSCVILTGGQMLIYQDALRKRTGQEIPHIHQEKEEVIDLKDCYIYSGLIVEEDLLYQNRTFDVNQAGMLAATPRIFLNDGYTSADVDVMTCFVLWMNRKKGWFRSVVSNDDNTGKQVGNEAKGSTKSQLKRVAQLGVTGRSMVFKCRSRAERDLWVLSVAAEIENAIERELQVQGKVAEQGSAEVRLQH